MLDDDAIARYARQIVVPGIGAGGQQKLLSTTVLVAGHPRGVAQASLYLRAAGVRVVDDGSSAADIAIVAGTASVPAPLLSSLAASALPVCWYTLGDEGFTAGVHPGAPLPPPGDVSAGQHAPQDALRDALHDAAACDAAATACAIALGLAHRDGPVVLEL